MSLLQLGLSLPASSQRQRETAPRGPAMLPCWLMLPWSGVADFTNFHRIGEMTGQRSSLPSARNFQAG